MNKIILGASAFTFLLIAIPVFAANNGAGARLGVSPSTTGNQVQNINQVKTQNEGENSQMQVNIQEAQGQSASNAALKVEELLITKILQGGIGDQIRQVAQEQKTAQQEIQAELGKVDNRGGLLKSIIGPDFKALKNMQKQVEQNQLHIQQLTQLRDQIPNEGDTAQVQEMIQILTNQNNSLQDKINLEEQFGSLFGWLFRMFVY